MAGVLFKAESFIGTISDQKNYYTTFVLRVVYKKTIVQVHTPGLKCAGYLIPGRRVVFKLCKNPHSKIKYALIAVYVDKLWVGVNPNLSNEIFLNILNANLTSFKYVSKEVAVDKFRYDFKLRINNIETLVELKTAFFKKNEHVFFPIKKGTDLDKIKIIPYKTPTSTRAIRQFKDLLSMNSLIVILIQRPDFKSFNINPREQELSKLYSEYVKQQRIFICVVKWTVTKNFAICKFKSAYWQK